MAAPWIRIGYLLASHDVKQTYRRSVLGQGWITLGMAVLIGTIAVVFGVIFGAELDSYLPYVAIGIVVFSLMTGIANEGSQSFISAEAMIRQSNVPLPAHHFRVVLRVVFIFLHNLLIIPVVLLLTSGQVSWVAGLALPGLALVILTLGGLSLVLSVLASRFRDVPPIVSAVFTVGFYVTPVIWSPKQLEISEFLSWLLLLNPLNHLLEVVRSPLLGEMPTPTNWLVSILAAICFSSLGVVVLKSFQKKIVLWV